MIKMVKRGSQKSRSSNLIGSKFLFTYWAKSPKKQSVGSVFWQHGTVFWVSN